MILVTGATGFVGQHLVRRLQERGEAVRPLVRDARTARRAQGQSLEPAMGDVTDPTSLRRAIAGVDIVIHLAAIMVERDRAAFEAVNAQGTRNVVDAAREAGVQRFLHLSANGAHEASRSRFLCSKWRGEQAVVASGLRYGILRPSLVFGAGDRFFTVLAALARLGPVVPVPGNGTSRFQPVCVEDLCTCMLQMLDDDTYLGQSFAIGGPEQLTLDDMVDIVMRVLGRRRPKMHVPMALLQPAVRAMQAVLPVTPGQLDLLTVDNTTAPNSLPAIFGIAHPAYLQAGLGYIRRPS